MGVALSIIDLWDFHGFSIKRYQKHPGTPMTNHDKLEAEAGTPRCFRARGLRLFPALSQIRQLLCSRAGRRGGIAEGRGSQDLSHRFGRWAFPGGYPWVAQIGWFTMEITQTDPKMDEQECPQFSMETYGKLHMVMERPFAVPN